METLDTTEILAKFAGDWEFVRAVAATFVAESPKQVEALKEAFKQQDRQLTNRAAHTLKSSFGAFSKGTAFQKAIAIEQESLEADWSRLEQLLIELEAAFHKLLSAVSALKSPAQDH